MSTRLLPLLLTACLTAIPEQRPADGAARCASPWFADADGDGVGHGPPVCRTGPGYTPFDGDCDDQDVGRRPGAPDLAGDAIDQNCDFVDGEDGDGDGHASIDSGGDDCDDEDEYVGDGEREVCNDLDDDCDGEIDVDDEGVGVCEAAVVVDDTVDLLFVVDNSCSMSDEQQALAAAGQQFLGALQASGLDFHLGVVSTDMTDDQGRLAEAYGYRWVERTTANPALVFAELLQLGTTGSGLEKGTDAVYAAVETEGAPGRHNDGFFRDEASLLVTAVTDEEDMSTRSTEDFVDWYEALRPNELVEFNSVVSMDTTCATYPGERYLEVTRQVGGLSWDICSVVWASMYGGIADQLPTEAVVAIPLPEEPAPDSLHAQVAPLVGLPTEYGASELSWDAATQTVPLPDPAPIGATVTLRWAPLNP